MSVCDLESFLEDWERIGKEIDWGKGEEEDE